MVIWLIGMSASGKTSIGAELIRHLREEGQTWLFIDGDRFRAILGEELGHTTEDRRRIGERMCNLSVECAHQGINLVVSILSIFPEHQAWNRKHIPAYREVFIDVPLDVLVRRDNKGLYRQALDGELRNVVGVDIPFPRPRRPDLMVDNSGDLPNVVPIAKQIIKGLGLAGVTYRYSSEDRLETPEKYQYTAYLGEEFLRAYVDSRRGALLTLEERLKRLPDGSEEMFPLRNWENFKHCKEVLSRFESQEECLENWDLDGLEEAGTTEILLFLLRKFARDGALCSSMNDIVLKLLQRFEVSKRLYARYCLPDVKSVSPYYEDMVPYGLFCLLLLNLARESESPDRRMIFMNTAIKLGDVLTSCLHRYATPLEVWVAYGAITVELEMVEVLREELLA